MTGRSFVMLMKLRQIEGNKRRNDAYSSSHRGEIATRFFNASVLLEAAEGDYNIFYDSGEALIAILAGVSAVNRARPAATGAGFLISPREANASIIRVSLSVHFNDALFHPAADSKSITQRVRVISSVYFDSRSYARRVNAASNACFSQKGL